MNTAIAQLYHRDSKSFPTPEVGWSRYIYVAGGDEINGVPSITDGRPIDVIAYDKNQSGYVLQWIERPNRDASLCIITVENYGRYIYPNYSFMHTIEQFCKSKYFSS